MKINIENFIIESDAKCFQLIEIKKKGDENKNAGEEYRNVVGYYVDFDSVLRALCRQKLLRSNVTTLEGVFRELAEIQYLLKQYKI